MGEAALGTMRRTARFALDLLLPPRCLACGETVADPGALCAACWPRLEFFSPPHCACCGYPFEYDTGPGSLCGACARQHPPFRCARSVLRYDESSRGLVISFKHRDRTDAAPAYGRWMARAGTEMLGNADVIVPVPLHRSRLIARRFNQAALLAQSLSRETGIACLPDLLVRTRATPSQGKLNAAQRRRNVQGAFSVRARRLPKLQGCNVLLVDDVYTTGATVGACTGVLRRNGAAAVDVLTLARVVRPMA